MIAAAPPLAALAHAMKTPDDELVTTLAIACGDLAHGFAAPPESRTRVSAHHRAWVGVRQLDRAVQAARIRRLAPAPVVARAQRAVDRADILVGSLPGVVPA